MEASFEEKSVWIQLTSLLLALGAYFCVAGAMLAEGVRELPPYVPLFAVAIIFLVVLMTMGHAIVAIIWRPEERDERDRLIGWRSESNSSWILGGGVIVAIMGLIVSVETVYIAHFLLLSMFLSEVAKYLFQLRYYRRGI